MADKVHVIGTRKRWVLLGTSRATRSHFVEGCSGRIHEDDDKRGDQSWAGVLVGPRGTGRALALGHSGKRIVNGWAWRFRWRRLRHPIRSRRPSTPMGVNYGGETDSGSR